MIADLHCHSKLSDGSSGIEDLIINAKRVGLDFLAITDHDTMAGVTRATVLGKRHGLNVVPGMEASSIDTKRGRKVHILAYLFDKPDRLEGLCAKNIASRRNAGTEMLKKLLKLYPITADMVMRHASGSNCVNKQHMMHTLIEAGYTDRMYGDLYEELFNEKKGLCAVPIPYPDVFFVAKLIKSAGGIVVLAHPGEYNSFDVMQELYDQNLLDGVEIWHPRNSEDDRKRIMEFADEHKLLKTGGTDFHGMYSSRSYPIGSFLTPSEEVDRLFAFKKNQG